MLPTKLLLLLIVTACFNVASAQKEGMKDTVATTQYTGKDSVLNLRLAKKVKTTITRISGLLVDGMDEFTYTVLVQNKNEVAVTATIGGLVYGHYKNCIEKRENFVAEGTMDEKKVTLPARSSNSIVFMLQRKSNPPGYCAGIPSEQKAKVIRVVEHL